MKKRTATKVAVADWVSKYEEHPEEAVLDLINFILKVPSVVNFVALKLNYVSC